MSTGVGVANLKLDKGGRKLKKVRHCTIHKTLNKVKKKLLNSELNWKQKVEKEKATVDNI